jgi:hypothetical protein
VERERERGREEEGEVGARGVVYLPMNVGL